MRYKNTELKKSKKGVTVSVNPDLKRLSLCCSLIRLTIADASLKCDKSTSDDMIHLAVVALKNFGPLDYFVASRNFDNRFRFFWHFFVKSSLNISLS